VNIEESGLIVAMVSSPSRVKVTALGAFAELLSASTAIDLPVERTKFSGRNEQCKCITRYLSPLNFNVAVAPAFRASVKFVAHGFSPRL